MTAHHTHAADTREPAPTGWQGLWRRAVQTARLCCGVPDYDRYVKHLREHHPERAVPSYDAFFRERQEARYRGTGGRCC